MHINLIIYIQSKIYYICIFIVKKVIIYFKLLYINYLANRHNRNLLI